MKYLEYSNDELKIAVETSHSVAEVLRKINLVPCGGNYYSIQRKIQILGFSCDHFTGKAWNKNKQVKDWSGYTKNSALKKHLIRSREHKCESCNLKEWSGNPIPLEVHHVDGDRTNNNQDNLQLLCCNCHACTDNWRGRKNKVPEDQSPKPPQTPKKQKTYTSVVVRERKINPLQSLSKDELVALLIEHGTIKLGKMFGISQRLVLDMAHALEIDIKTISRDRMKKFNPSKEHLEGMIKEKSFSQIAKEYGVSDNAVKKRCLSLGLDTKEARFAHNKERL